MKNLELEIRDILSHALIDCEVSSKSFELAVKGVTNLIKGTCDEKDNVIKLNPRKEVYRKILARLEK